MNKKYEHAKPFDFMPKNQQGEISERDEDFAGDVKVIYFLDCILVDHDDGEIGIFEPDEDEQAQEAARNYLLKKRNRGYRDGQVRKEIRQIKRPLISDSL